ncbi:CopG family transcriptional regulator [Rhizobium ruizarguesonis]|uniref:type II toxin-antitoxin system BrnA family antitoxin n=1 Tax=Rhizobium ruizarguesonis TaxID=2081791 RepID=UPI0010315625|nr:CopG family transcriptional regulator [Rhizobium ruizarguesonis]TAZ20685.1 CopG family transcriptional regulator [Rhizobium ruizarguesonis]
MKASEFDQRFDAGEDMSGEVDWSKAQRPNLAIKRVNVDFATWAVEGLDRESQRLGITRQALIKVWIAERLDRLGRE